MCFVSHDIVGVMVGQISLPHRKVIIRNIGTPNIYQIELDKQSNGTADGLTTTHLLISAEHRTQSLALATPE
ncbi:hypothetical protein PSCICO_54180 [Pseudomonas cichorii]|nr:hypothetical protein PSCICO_54180 [Pseudomonas cichorii]